MNLLFNNVTKLLEKGRVELICFEDLTTGRYSKKSVDETTEASTNPSRSRNGEI